MKKMINQHPSRYAKVFLAMLPFLIVIGLYLVASDARLSENPNDKLLPAFSSFVDSMERMAFEPNKRSGDYLLWTDTLASLQRLLMGVIISALIGLSFGLLNGALPFARAPLSPFVTAISLIPPMAILPILFIVFGLGELAKVALIVIGIAPLLIRDMQQRVLEIPTEQIIKAQTLGANSWQIMIRIMLPQIMPRLLAAVRLALGSAWLFLIAAEAVASTDGLGYRIFLVRRYMAMDVILPYVLWITFLAFCIDWTLRRISLWAWPWFHSAQPDSGASS